MTNWYRYILAFKGINPRMDDPDDRERDPYQLTKNPYLGYDTPISPAPIFGGETREGYPKGVSQNEEPDERGGLNNIPGENVLMDQDPPTGTGPGASDRFTDPVDSLQAWDKKPEPRGPSNMNGDSIFSRVSVKSRLKSVRKT